MINNIPEIINKESICLLQNNEGIFRYQYPYQLLRTCNVCSNENFTKVYIDFGTI